MCTVLYLKNKLYVVLKIGQGKTVFNDHLCFFSGPLNTQNYNKKGSGDIRRTPYLDTTFLCPSNRDDNGQLPRTDHDCHRNQSQLDYKSNRTTNHQARQTYPHINEVQTHEKKLSTQERELSVREGKPEMSNSDTNIPMSLPVTGDLKSTGVNGTAVGIVSPKNSHHILQLSESSLLEPNTSQSAFTVSRSLHSLSGNSGKHKHEKKLTMKQCKGNSGQNFRELGSSSDEKKDIITPNSITKSLSTLSDKSKNSIVDYSKSQFQENTSFENIALKFFFKKYPDRKNIHLAIEETLNSVIKQTHSKNPEDRVIDHCSPNISQMPAEIML